MFAVIKMSQREKREIKKCHKEIVTGQNERERERERDREIRKGFRERSVRTQTKGASL